MFRIISGFKISTFKKFSRDFHISKNSREKYNFDEKLYSLIGDLIIADFPTARLLANKINTKRKEEKSEEQMVTAGQLNAVGLLHEIFHYLIRVYEEQYNVNVFKRSLNTLQNKFSDVDLNSVFLEFINQFPPMEVYKNKKTPQDYLNGSTDGKPNKEILLEEIILLSLENSNPAASMLKELYDDRPLSERSKYINFLDETEKFFITEKPFGKENLPLFEFLRKPIVASPYSLEGQLDFIREKWGVYVYEKFNQRLLKGKDLILEDLKLFLQHGGGEKGTPPVPSYEFDTDYFDKLKAKLAAGQGLTEDESRFYYSEIEKFTKDIDWMPKVVMIAKNAHVWLYQLSKKYNREITRLDQIPDEELDRLSAWNYTAIWLIGIWERSSASRKIKQIMGNPEAAASAYSLYDYVIANDLGGESAFENLKERAWKRGIRLASDMVPNHTGIYSKWVVEKPDYFIQNDYPPFPGYTFNGPNLSDDDRVEVKIEDKYYERTDAAVVFQRRDKYSGENKYIYHGNDGTNMPWNDTAQLNLLNPEVRESLIQTIMHVARKTPIIRFDAAMTLAKKHYQRLWFPQPGTGGAIPSRSDFSLTREEFDRAMPEEFWREVVDRINKEMPETLLLAEAFWLMEGYFVRTLGMHRVYNSAFMHMMMKEENEKYRLLIKNTIEFNPEILKRYVNFMSNPDEETAVNQFGKGDKYFGVAMLLVTLPGLPMFGHGQIEGFSEKYGMEYKRAYYDEFIDDHLVWRHQKEIFPLMSKRHLFSQVDNFELFDFIDDHGNVNHNVFAFTNKSGEEKTLVVYNNSYSQCAGTIKQSSSKVRNNNLSDLQTKSLAESLELKNDNNIYYIYRDHRSGQEFIINGYDIHKYGYYFALQGYEYVVCLNFREVYDSTGIYEKVYRQLLGKGVYSIEEYINDLNLEPLHNSVYELLNDRNLGELNKFYYPEIKSLPKNINQAIDNIKKEDFSDNIYFPLNNLLSEVNKRNSTPIELEKTIDGLKKDYQTGELFSYLIKRELSKKSSAVWIKEASLNLLMFPDNKKQRINLLHPVIVLSKINFTVDDDKNVVDKYYLYRVLYNIYEKIGFRSEEINNYIHLIKILTSDKNKILWQRNGKAKPKKNVTEETKVKNEIKQIVNHLFENDLIRNYLNFNEYQSVVYYSKDQMITLTDWIFTLRSIYYSNPFYQDIITQNKSPKKAAATKNSSNNTETVKLFFEELKINYLVFNEIKKISDESGYKAEKLKEIVNKNGKSTKQSSKIKGVAKKERMKKTKNK